jgi:cysteine synthase A
MFNPAGSIKFKPAVGIVKELEKRKRLGPGQGIIDTSSGNMGIALSIVARARGYRFVCVCDDKITPHNQSLLQAYGAELVILSGSTLRDRYRYIDRRLDADPTLVWTRQFSNTTNPETHEATTAEEILREVPELTHLFVGAGTCGTLCGCAQAFAKHQKSVRLVAVDAYGSNHFDCAPKNPKRYLPGIGATEPSPFLLSIVPHDVAIIKERDAIGACRELASKTGWLFGASTGSVLAAIKSFQSRFQKNDVVVGIAADSGERYLDNLYDDNWVSSYFPEPVRMLRPESEAVV